MTSAASSATSSSPSSRRIEDLTRIVPEFHPGHHPRERGGHAQYPKRHALEWYDYRTSVDAIEDSTRAMRRCLDVLNALGTELQGLLEVGVDAGPVN